MARLLEETAVVELERRKTDALVHQAAAALRIAEADNQAVLLQLETRRLTRLLAADAPSRDGCGLAPTACLPAARVGVTCASRLDLLGLRVGLSSPAADLGAGGGRPGVEGRAGDAR